MPEFEVPDRSSSEVVRDGWPSSIGLVRTFNHIGSPAAAALAPGRQLFGALFNRAEFRAVS